MSNSGTTTASVAASVAAGTVIGLFVTFVMLLLSCCGGLLALGEQARNAEQTVTVVGEDGSPRQTQRVEVVKVDASVTEDNSVYTQYAYILNVRNNGGTYNQSFEVELLDSSGFVIDRDLLYSETLAPGDNVIRGTILVHGAKRNAIASVNAKLRR